MIARGEGCKLYDPKGWEFLDCTVGIVVNALSHCDPDWVRVVTEQANLLTHVSNVYYSIPQVKQKKPCLSFYFSLILYLLSI